MTEQPPQSPPPAPGSVPAEKNRGRVFSIIGAVLGVAALLFFPIFLGPVGAVLGFVGYAKGDKPLGLIVGIGSIVTTIIGAVIGALLVTQMQGA